MSRIVRGISLRLLERETARPALLFAVSGVRCAACLRAPRWAALATGTKPPSARDPESGADSWRQWRPRSLDADPAHADFTRASGAGRSWPLPSWWAQISPVSLRFA